MGVTGGFLCLLSLVCLLRVSRLLLPPLGRSFERSTGPIAADNTGFLLRLSVVDPTGFDCSELMDVPTSRGDTMI